MRKARVLIFIKDSQDRGRSIGVMIRVWLTALIVFALCACAVTTERASLTAEPSPAERGRTFATRICAECHAVADGEPASPNFSATPFETIANTPGMTRIALNAWLHTGHPTMPNVQVDQDETDDLWAYLLTLRD